MSDDAIRVRSHLLSSLRIALVHDYLNQEGGAEKVLDVLCRMFPAAPVFTSVYDPAAMGDSWKHRQIRTSFMQLISPRISVAKTLLPLYPIAFESFDFDGYDLVISSASSFAKGIRIPTGGVHVCYCYTPSRFLWSYDDYVRQQALPAAAKLVLPAVVGPLKAWDYRAAQRPQRILGISNAVASRIRSTYGRQAAVVFPPVDVSRFRPLAETDDYFLVVARLAAYKRIDIAVEACTRLNRALVVVGDGPDRKRLEAIAGPSVRFAGRLPDEDVVRMLGRCRALLWPGEEDFGLAPVEAQSSGRPVIAYRAGGVLDTVSDGVTGVLFEPQTVDAMIDAIGRFDTSRFNSADLDVNARRFDTPVFIENLVRNLEEAVTNRPSA
jgi:glycosyltransferase involved in cell wall biosynthesis